MNKNVDLIIIGGGIMGLFTAYFASKYSNNIVLLEKRTIGNKYAASSGYSRSIRNDYLDPFYARLAAESQIMWQNLETETRKKFILKCGVLNIANKTSTPDLKRTYATLSSGILTELGFANKLFDKDEMKRRYPQFKSDVGCLDIDAGFLYIPDIIEGLTDLLNKKGVRVIGNFAVSKITRNNRSFEVKNLNGDIINCAKLIMTAGAWSLDLLDKFNETRFLKLPIIPIPQKLEYFKVPNNKTEIFNADKMPVFAYLDVGIYGHPLYKKTPGLKIAYFDPLGAKLVKSVFNPAKQLKIKNNRDFISECLPLLKNTQIVETEDNYYDMTPDNNFIIDKLPGIENAYIAAGFCGTGYKFAPVVGKIMAELAFRSGTVYDIKRFSAKRFGKFTNGSIIKSLPLYKNFIYPRNWKYLKSGFNALMLKNAMS